jgi:ATP synthase F1 complex assembly factor 2
VPLRRDAIIFELLKFFHTDLACCRDEDGTPLAIRQAELLDPVVEYASKQLGQKINVSDALMGAEQSEEASDALNKMLRGLCDYELAALDAVGGVCKSTLISMNVLNGNISVDDAVAASRIEEDMQMDKWGLVEGGHDIDIAGVRVGIASPTVFLQLAGRR